MKAIVFACIAIGLLQVVRSEDDGKYRPDLYSDNSGKYNGRYYNYDYNNYLGRSGLYYPNYAYQPQYYNSFRPYHELLAPVVATKSNSVIPVAVTSTAAPIVVSSAAPVVVATPKYVYTKNYGNEAYARIIEQDNDATQNSYQYKYRTENGINAAETGVVDAANQHGGTRVTGFYEYVGDNGLTYRVDYVADENGFRATGAHLPKA